MNTQELYDYLHTNYEYRDGHLYYKQVHKLNTNCKIGDRAGTQNGNGYWHITIKDKIYKAHHLVYLYHNQKLPKMIDHINHIKNDNRIENLREVTDSENGHNRGTPKNNSSGYKGVSWAKANKKWKSQIRIDNKYIFLGYYSTPELAYEAYCNYVQNNLTIYCLGDNNGSV